MTTLKDIARLANTSLGTVDRALNNKPGVSPKTRERILAIAESLDYKTNKLGKALVLRNRNIQLGFIVEPVSNPFFEELKRGAEEMSTQLQEWGISTHIFCMNTHGEREMLELLGQLQEMGVAGIALNPINSPLIQEKITELRAQGISVVTCSTDIAGENRDCFVGFCHEQSGRVAAELLAKFSAKKGNFLAVIGYRYIMAHMQRLGGFTEKLKETYPGIRVSDVLEVEENDQLALKKTLEALEKYPDINGIFIAGYGIKGVAEAVKIKGKGESIAIVCYDNAPFVKEYVKQGVIDAIICQDPVRQGAMALKILSEIVTGSREHQKSVYMTDIDIRMAENLEKDELSGKI